MQDSAGGPKFGAYAGTKISLRYIRARGGGILGNLVRGFAFWRHSHSHGPIISRCQTRMNQSLSSWRNEPEQTAQKCTKPKDSQHGFSHPDTHLRLKRYSLRSEGHLAAFWRRSYRQSVRTHKNNRHLSLLQIVHDAPFFWNPLEKFSKRLGLKKKSYRIRDHTNRNISLEFQKNPTKGGFFFRTPALGGSGNCLFLGLI